MKRIIVFLIMVFFTSGFDYDKGFCKHKVIGTVHTVVGEVWRCKFNWRGGANQIIVITSDNAPEGMYIDPQTYTFSWSPKTEHIGLHYVDFKLGRQVDPNTIWISDRGTVVIKVDEWLDPPFWELIGPLYRF